ncbi:MAG TPA: prolyl oligopeptidase family serine peptidase [Pyrinomonadaceae bacterium]|nr:S9 family peptidase [Chloracidobacterium sp.]HRJ90333.1 prolyl oligopeptidase family serine peptidase [Pyrinomonadaceae bacterium]HRK50126.1 prolyl oligopeptidase family serine peptidase [Pyrinomonadaceae bacterium]
MFRRTLIVLVLVSFLSSAIPAQTGYSYPKAKKVDQVDDYHGTKVSDPYRWMEDTGSADTQKWIEDQVKFTQAYLDKIPERAKIRERLTEIWNYERISAPSKVADGFYIYSRNDGLQNQSVLYRAKSKDDPGSVFFDPNKLSTDGTAALSGSSFTDDGKLWAYGVAKSGSDRTEWRIMNTETGEYLADTLRPNRQGGVSWLKDNSGFYYSRFPDAQEGAELRAANKFQKIYFHKLGTPQSDDTLVYERPEDGELFMGGGVTEDGKWLVISVAKGTQRMNEIHFKDLSRPDSPIVPLVNDRNNSWSFVGNDGPVFYFRTDKDAERGKLVSVNVLARARIWKDIVPQAAETLNGVQMINNQFVTNYLKDAYTNIKIYDKAGKHVRDVELPGIGSAGGFGGKQDATETFYTYSSYNAPPTIYHYDMRTGKSTLFRQAKVKFDPDGYEVKQVFFTSKDGTRVPMFLTHKKGLKLDGSNPTILYGYGGFNISQTPGFSVSRAVWMEMGGIYAVANIRGGAEYGKEWWANGARLKKQNVFDDFIAAAEFLIANKYTSTPKLAIQGGSNGGLLVGAVLNQRPDLFGAALPAVGVMDMVRFTEFTVGAAWKSDYGDPKDPKEFAALYAYSPLHNIKKGTKYPATMVTTADTDDRVFPAHSFKYAAALQDAQAGDKPILIRIETKAGHGAGKPTSKQIEEQADIYGFLVKSLGIKMQ